MGGRKPVVEILNVDHLTYVHLLIGGLRFECPMSTLPLSYKSVSVIGRDKGTNVCVIECV